MSIFSRAVTELKQIPKLLYGSRLRGGNGLSQRGPDSYDCIGWVEHILLVEAPQFLPSSWGLDNPWTVPEFLDMWQSHGLKVTFGPAHAGDILVFEDARNNPFHIGISDGKGGVLSALNTKMNICLVPANSILPKGPILVLPTNSEDDVIPINAIVTLVKVDGTPANTLDEVDIRTRLLGDKIVDSRQKRIVPNSVSYTCFAYDPSGTSEFAEPVYKTFVNGQIVSILARNGYATQK
jgi:hypothetical protein